MRIVDYLKSDDDGSDHHGTPETDVLGLHQCGRSENSIAGKTRRRNLISRLFSFSWRCGGTRLARHREHEETEGEGVNGLKEGDSGGTPGRICEGCRIRVATSQNLAECHKQEMNFNLVAGLGLLSLVAATKSELEKTMELRRQMEIFFQELKECQIENKISDPSGSEVSCLNKDARLVAACCGRHFCTDHSPEHSIASSAVTLMCGQYSKSDTTPREDCIEGMNQFQDLEVELETELELLQLHLQAEESSHHDCQSAGTPTASSSKSSSDIVYHQPEANIEQCGVNPLELERRLHELLEARQEERIRELELVLKQTNKKLQEHETGASWWKDTTMIISKHLPESSSVSR